jgi:acetate---CoA ligase (ADP-forming)
METSTIDLPSLRPLFEPRSIAVIGASATPGKIGAAPISFLQRAGFSGAIYPVSRTSAEIAGLRAYANVRDIEAPIDMAIFAVPAAQIPAVFEECAAKGVRSGVMFTSGFAESDADGAAAQVRLADGAARGGMRLLGPNCLGIANYAAGVFASFSPFFAQTPSKPGHMALVSQSGAFGGYAAMAAQDLGISFSYWMTTGNEADVDLADGLGFLAHDPQTRVILGYMEGCRNGPKLVRALEMCRQQRKPVVMLKVGRTEVGAAAAASHTASLAGADNVYDAIFSQYDVYRADSIDEWFDVGRAAAAGRLPKSNRIALVTASGGVGVFMADEAVAKGLDVAPLNEYAQAEIKKLVPFAGTRNPVDVTGQAVADIKLFEATIEAIADSDDYASFVGFHAGIGRSPAAGGRLQKAWAELRRRYPDKIIAVSGASTPELDLAYEAGGCLAFRDPGRAVRAVAALRRFAEAFDRKRGGTPDIPSALAADINGTLSEAASLDLLREAGFPVMSFRNVHSADEAAEAAEQLGYPVVLKIVSPDILHKSDIGGVVLSLTKAADVRRAYEDVLLKAKSAMPSAQINGCLVAPMIKGGVETIVGVQRDPVFGMIVMFGLGGVLVEVLRDVSFRAAPFREDEALRMIAETKAAAVLRGVRGAPPGDLSSLATALSRLSLFAAANAGQIESIDINPFLVRPDGQGGCALDAVVVGRSPTAASDRS